MKRLLFVTLLLAGCSDNSLPPPPSNHPGQVSMSANAWTLAHGVGVGPISAAAGGGFQFDFPQTVAGACPGANICPSVHYVQTVSPLLSGKTSISMSGQIVTSGNPQFNYMVSSTDGNQPGGHAPSCRPWFQQAGDDLSGQGAYQYYRWWAVDPADVVLQPGSYNVTVNLTSDKWLSVFGQMGNYSAAATSGFNQAMGNSQNIGFTCGGGSFFGHGVNFIGGSATMIVNSFTVK